MLNSYNKKLAEAGRRRRAMFYRLHTHKTTPLSATELARKYRISPQRMSYMLRQAKQEAEHAIKKGARSLT